MKLFPMILFLAAVLHAGTAVVDKIRVHYDVSGTGSPTLVLVHGWTCDGAFWSAQNPELSKHFRVLTVDLPGHGKSDKPEVEYTLDLMARGVLAAMDDAKARRVILIGHSMGTSVSRQVIELARDRVAALISIDGSVFRPTPAMKGMPESLRDPGNRRKFIEGMFKASTPPEQREFITKGMLATPDHVAYSAFSNSVFSDVWSKPPVSIPVLAINQKASRERSLPLYKEVFQNLDYRDMDDVSHFLHMEKPAEVNAMIIGFARKVGK